MLNGAAGIDKHRLISVQSQQRNAVSYSVIHFTCSLCLDIVLYILHFL